MTYFCELIISLVVSIVGGLISVYIVNFFNKRHKNNRHE